MRDTVPSPRFSTQTPPNPLTIPVGRCPTSIVSTTRFLPGSTTSTRPVCGCASARATGVPSRACSRTTTSAAATTSAAPITASTQRGGFSDGTTRV